MASIVSLDAVINYGDSQRQDHNIPSTTKGDEILVSIGQRIPEKYTANLID